MHTRYLYQYILQPEEHGFLLPREIKAFAEFWEFSHQGKEHTKITGSIRMSHFVCLTLSVNILLECV